jgi:hypothetical protein
MSNLVEERVPPVEGDGPDVWLLVIEDMKARRELGIKKYGMPVRPFNGRDALVDAFQEALDLVVYLKQVIEEREIDRKKARPTRVCLCGSTRFKEAYEKAMAEETLAGKIVLTVGLFGHREGLDMEGEVKKRLDELHLRKIDEADEILVINVGGYVGESTKREIEYAFVRGKKIRYLEDPKK